MLSAEQSAAPAETTSIAGLVETTPVIVLTDSKKREALFAHIQKEISTFEHDLSSETGRKRTASLAYKVARTKTAIDDAGKVLIEDAQKLVKSTNEERKAVRDKLDELRDLARKPLDDWEEAEKARVERCNDLISRLKSDAQVSFDDTADTVWGRLVAIKAMQFDQNDLGDFFDIITDAHAAAEKTLTEAHVRILREEADRAELQRLREAQAEREQSEQHTAYVRSLIQHIIDCGRGFIGGEMYPLPILFRELETKVSIDESFGELRGEAEKALKEALENLLAAAKKQEEEAQAAIEAEAIRRADEAAASAREESERLATEAQAKKDQAHAEELQRAAQEKADLVAQQEREAAERKAEEQRVADEAAARAADRDHRSAIMGAAKEALMAEGGIGEDRAKKIVLAIAAGSIPHITINF